MLLLTSIFLLAFAAVLAAQSAPTVADAEQFMNKAEARLAELSVKVNQPNWVHDNFITDDTEALAAAANDEITAVTPNW
jgi:peptidyl-dipeptidase A